MRLQLQIEEIGKETRHVQLIDWPEGEPFPSAHDIVALSETDAVQVIQRVYAYESTGWVCVLNSVKLG